MHTIHHTRAVIIKSQPSGESNKLFWLFTEDFGLVVVVATGVRKSGAKLNGQLIDYTVIDVDLVQGREVWRLVSATVLFDPLDGSAAHPLARAYVRTLATLDRFLTGEGIHPELFAHIYECAAYLRVPRADAKAFDTLAIWRTLAHLGYIAVEEDERQLFDASFAQALDLLDPAVIKNLVATVNVTIKETHL